MLLGARFPYRLARLLTLTLGGLAIAWAAWSLGSPPAAIGYQIVSGGVFPTETLDRLLKALESKASKASCDPTVLQSIALIRLRLIEHRLRLTEQEPSRTQEDDNDLADLRSAIERSLACAPADSFLWLILYWVSDKL